MPIAHHHIQNHIIGKYDYGIFENKIYFFSFLHQIITCVLNCCQYLGIFIAHAICQCWVCLDFSQESFSLAMFMYLNTGFSPYIQFCDQWHWFYRNVVWVMNDEPRRVMVTLALDSVAYIITNGKHINHNN